MITRKNLSFFLRCPVYLFILGISCLLFLPQHAYASQGHVKAYYFYSRDCKECIEITDSYIPGLSKKYGSNLEIKCLEINEPENLELLFELEKGSRRLNNPLPSIFIGDRILDGEAEIKEKLDGLIEYYVLEGGRDWPAAPGQRTGEPHGLALEKFKSLGVPVIIGAGLLDGINPCAFTTVIFLISYLALVGRKDRDILLIGWTFTLAVFVTYLLIGLGLFELIKRAQAFSFLSRIASLFIAALAALLGILSLYDYYKIKKGRLKDITLQLPRGFKDKIHSAVREGSRAGRFIPASLSLGFLVAFLEFPCTGQTYLPVIFVLRHMPELKARAIFYLLLYNLMFILPLIAVFIFAYRGASSRAFIGLMQKNAGKVKILTAILFFILASVLFVYKH